MPQLILLAFVVYALLGLVFAAWWIIAGAHRIDPVINDAKFTTKLLFIPGAVGLWPWLFAKAINADKSRSNAIESEENAQGAST